MAANLEFVVGDIDAVSAVATGRVGEQSAKVGGVSGIGFGGKRPHDLAEMQQPKVQQLRTD